MNLAIPLHLSGKYKACLVAVILLFAHFRCFGQSCDCPAVDSCGPCEGGLTSLTIRYTGGLLGLTLTISDGGGVLYSSSSVLSGAVITVTSSNPGQPFVDGFVTVTGTLLFSETLVTDCSDPVNPGTVYTYFEILGAESLEGGVLCCAEADMEKNAPVMTGCPTAINKASTSTGCSTTVTWTEPTATDDCGNVELTSTHDPGDPFPVGTTTVTYTATDDYGNTETCSFDVTVTDNTAPVISNMPSDFTVPMDPGACSARVDWTPPTATDNCGEVTLSSIPYRNSDFLPGTTTVEYTATDDHGNIRKASFKVTVEDKTAPAITCPADELISFDASCAASLPDYTGAVADDNCSGPVSVSQSPVAGTALALGVTAVTLTATDGAGNTSTCTFDVTVEDTTAPAITCPADQFISVDAVCKTSLPDYTTSAADDNCTVSVTQSPAAGTILAPGVTAVTLTATDEADNTSSCTFDVTVEDTTAPAITCPADQFISVDAICKASLPDYTTSAADDNCTVSVTQSPAAGSTLGPGVTAVTLTATDKAGNTSTCTFDVTVEDTADPAITCPGDQLISVDGSCEASLPDYTAADIDDNCLKVSVTQSPPKNTPLTVGVTVVTLTATDKAGNTSTCKFNVTVEDTTDPAITCPEDQFISVDVNCEATLPDYTAVAPDDNCSGTMRVTQSPDAGAILKPGVTVVMLTATDKSGNTSTCTFDVTVKDTTDPAITCPGDQTLAADESCQLTLPDFTQDAAAGDNCLVFITQSPEAGTALTPGTITPVTLTATDEAGNAVTCTFDVVMKDETAPVISNCPSPVIVALGSSECSKTIDWTPPAATENCGTVSWTSSHDPGDMFPRGTTTVTYTATDETGNTSSCYFEVTVLDNTKPVITGCKNGTIIEIIADETCEAVVTWPHPSATDNCNFTLTSNYNPGDVFPLGTTTVVYTATDNSGNVSICDFKVKVKNRTAPEMTGCPADITAEADASGKVQVNWLPPAASGACGEVSLTSSHQPGDYFTVGTTEVIYEASDAAGNSVLCRFNVIVSYEKIKFDIARVITPDGDGINDVWLLADIQKFQDNKVVIVDRWGSVIFSAAGYNNENVVWKGMNRNGSLVPTGTYFYTISVRFASDVVEKRGFIELIR